MPTLHENLETTVKQLLGNLKVCWNQAKLQHYRDCAEAVRFKNDSQIFKGYCEQAAETEDLMSMIQRLTSDAQEVKSYLEKASKEEPEVTPKQPLVSIE